MAVVNWMGGTHRITDPGVWIPLPPGPTDEADVRSGTLVAIHQEVGPYTLVLAADGSADPIPTVTLDAYQSTISGQINYSDAFADGSSTVPVGPAVINVVGNNTLTGGIQTGSNVVFGPGPAPLVLYVASVNAPDGVSVQAGSFDNKGAIDIGSRFGPTITVEGDADARFLNDGTVTTIDTITFDLPVLGNGTMSVGSLHTLYGAVFNKAVGSGQTIFIDGGEGSAIKLNDLIDFRGTISNFVTYETGIDFDQTITAANFYNHVLTLYNGTAVEGEIRFTNEMTAGDLLIQTGPTGTRIGQPNDLAPIFGKVGVIPNIAVTTNPFTPTLPPISTVNGPTRLPNTVGNFQIQIDSGTYVASTTQLSNYTIYMQGASASDSPTVDITNVTLGFRMDVRVSGQLNDPGFGHLNVVGYNEAQYELAAVSDSLGGVANFDIRLSNVLAPDGVVVQSGVLNNTGNISGNEDTVLDITGEAGTKLINSGTIVTWGMMFIGPAVTGTGTMTIGNHGGNAGSLELGGYIATGQSINLQAGALTIDDTHHFFATVFDFDARDQIVLKGVDVSRVTYNNGALLLDGGADGSLHFHRPTGVTFNTGSFLLSHSGTDTIITTPMQTT